MDQKYIWTDGIDNALFNIHKNSLNISDYHTKKYRHFSGYQKYFRVPIIILSGLNSVFNVGLQPFVKQEIISVLCCAISLLCGVISSIELFIGIQQRMEKELTSAKEFYILSSDIFKILSIERNNRTINGTVYLDTIHNKYCDLIQQSELVNEDNRKYRLMYVKPLIKYDTDLESITFIMDDENKDNKNDNTSSNHSDNV